MLLANFNGKEHLRHRAVSLRQHGFLVQIANEMPEHYVRYSRPSVVDMIVTSEHVKYCGQFY